MNRQFDNRFDELFNEKFRDFDKNPPDYILGKVKASLENPSMITKIGNFYKNNLLIAGFSLLIPAFIVGFYAFTGEKESSAISHKNAVSFTEVKNERTNKNSVIKESTQINSENKKNKVAALFFNEVNCGLSCNLKATSTQGKWTCSSAGVVFAASNSASTFVNVTKEGTYCFIWTPIEESMSIENVKVSFRNQVKNERPKEIISCTNEVVLEANSENKSGTWSAVNGVIFGNVNSLKTTAQYNGTGKVNLIWTNNVKCALSDTFTVFFAEKADASFEITEAAKCYDSQVILTARNKSFARYEWESENGTTNSLTPSSVSLVWAEGFKHKVSLKTWTKDNCFSSSSLILERPAQIDVQLDVKASNCGNNGSVKAVGGNSKAQYQYFWMNDKKSSGSFMNNLAPGKYDVTVRDNNSCSKIFSFEVPGTGEIKASFYHSNYDMNVPSTVYFVNTTTENNSMYENSDAIKFEWDFGDGQKSNEESPSHVYEKAGNYPVKLAATNKNGCSNIATTSNITIDPSRVVVPNIFSPNGDGMNDVFKVNSISLKNFHVQVSNIKGEEVYEWSDPEKGWDGTVLKSGSPASAGVYFYIVIAEGKDGKQYLDKGAVELRRE